MKPDGTATALTAESLRRYDELKALSDGMVAEIQLAGVTTMGSAIITGLRQPLKTTCSWRIASNPSTWVTLLAYAASAAVYRTGTLEVDSSASDAVGAANFLVPFAITFYFGYGYTRLNGQFWAITPTAGRAHDLVLMTKAYMKERADVEFLWRCINLMKVCGCCSITKTYHGTQDYILPFCREYGLLTAPMEERLLRLTGGQLAGQKAVREVALWALKCLDAAAARGDIDPTTRFNMGDHVLRMRGQCGELQDYCFWSIPIQYKHLLSAISMLWLVLTGIAKGALFTPGADIMFGVVVPALSMFVLSAGTVGLLELGSAYARPFDGQRVGCAIDLPVHQWLMEDVVATRLVVDSPEESLQPNSSL